jgi:putative ABC transport system ATP-binding protein
VQVLEALHEVNRDLGTATVLITHNASIQRIAHRVIVLADGKVVRDAVNPAPVPPSEVSW